MPAKKRPKFHRKSPPLDRKQSCKPQRDQCVQLLLLYTLDFWQAHDPTTLNRQGNDVGTQYRSAIYYIGDSQESSAKKAMEKARKLYKDPITTEVKELDAFYVAEGYHQDYYENNPNAPYCAFVIAPKIKKLKKKGLWDD